MDEKDRKVTITLTNNHTNKSFSSNVLITGKLIETKSKREIKDLFKTDMNGVLNNILKEKTITELLEA